MSSAELAECEILISAYNLKSCYEVCMEIHRDLLRNLATNTPVVSSEHRINVNT